MVKDGATKKDGATEKDDETEKYVAMRKISTIKE